MRRRLSFFFLTGAAALLLCSCNGAKTDHISFNFMDMTVSGKTQKLHRIDVMYPDDTDMNEVRKNMEQSF